MIEHPVPPPRGGVDAPRGVARAASALLDERLGPEEPALQLFSGRVHGCASSGVALSRIPFTRPSEASSSRRDSAELADGVVGLVFVVRLHFGGEKRGPRPADPL